MSRRAKIYLVRASSSRWPVSTWALVRTPVAYRAAAAPAAERAAAPVETAHITATLFYGSSDGRALVPVRRDVPLATGVVEQGRQILTAQLQEAPQPYVQVDSQGHEAARLLRHRTRRRVRRSERRRGQRPSRWLADRAAHRVRASSTPSPPTCRRCSASSCWWTARKWTRSPDTSMCAGRSNATRRSCATGAAVSHRQTHETQTLNILHYSDFYMRSDGRLAEQLRPTRITPNYLIHAEGSVLVEAGKTKVICTASVEDRVPPFRRNTRQGLGHGRIRHAAARDDDAVAARGNGRQGRRTHAGDSAAHRPLAARRHQARGDRRAHHHARLRRDPGGRRHANGVDHRRLRGAGPRGRRRCASRT